MKKSIAVLGALTLLIACQPLAAPSTQPAITLENCPFSATIVDAPPDDSNADPFGNGPWFINSDQSIWIPAQLSMGNNKLVWIRSAGTTGVITGKRLDAEAEPLAYTTPGGVGYPTGFEVGGLIFPTEGCWEVTATAGESRLEFVTLIP